MTSLHPVCRALFVGYSIGILVRNAPHGLSTFLEMPPAVQVPPKRVSLEYSWKNIPLPSNEAFRKRLIEMVESVLKRMRWKAFFFLRGDGDEAKGKDEKFGLKSQKCPPQVEELRAFEADMQKLIENVEFRKTGDEFQRKLKADLDRIRKTDAVFIPADKTGNLYEMDTDLYNKLLNDNVTKMYKSADEDAYDLVNAGAQRIAKELNVADRLETLARKEAFITLKDHKPNFANNLPCRLINPAKTELGLISKRILDKINTSLNRQLDVQLWKDSSTVVEWFQSIDQKKDCVFTCFDIIDFYPSISEKLLTEALDFASQKTTVTESEREVIFHSRKSLLFTADKDWVKKDTNLFDVTMGSFDGAEVCELVGIYALALLPAKYKRSDIGLYRDDGLAVHKNTSGPESKRIKKDLTKRFANLGLRLTIDTNLKIANYLDLTLNLNTGKYQPYRKPNDHPVYVHRSSNHPPSILKGIPASVSRRITDNSSDRQSFDEAAPPYNAALKASGYRDCIDFLEQRKREKRQKRRRSRNIIWFNPPFSKTVKTCLGRKFLQLIDKHFPKGSKLYAIFNRSTVKVSYSCMPNVATIIKAHNSRAVKKHSLASNPKHERLCNCRNPSNCPLKGKCLTSNIVYKATLEKAGSGEKKHYIGLTGGPFKQRYANHLSSFKHERYKDATELSKHAWELKTKGEDFSISWSIVTQAPAYTGNSKRCALCLAEKTHIATTDHRTLLNRRSELVSKCRHRDKFSLLNYVATG